MARRTLRRATPPQTLRTKGYTAAQCLKDSRKLFSDMITYLLRRTSGIPGAKMMWMVEELAMTQKVIYAFGVFLFGWPPDIPFQSPGRCSLRQLERLLLGVRRHKIYFVRVSPDEVQALEREHGIANFQGRRARSDAWTRAPLRPPETRSGHLRKAPIKTLPWVPTDADTKEVDWDVWMATYQPGCARARK